MRDGGFYQETPLGSRRTRSLRLRIPDAVAVDHDWLLLTTDGCHDYGRREHLERILKESDSPGAASSQCCEAAMAGGSKDNITALVARIDQLGPSPAEFQDDEDDESDHNF